MKTVLLATVVAIAALAGTGCSIFSATTPKDQTTIETRSLVRQPTMTRDGAILEREEMQPNFLIEGGVEWYKGVGRIEVEREYQDSPDGQFEVLRKETMRIYREGDPTVAGGVAQYRADASVNTISASVGAAVSAALGYYDVMKVKQEERTTRTQIEADEELVIARERIRQLEEEAERREQESRDEASESSPTQPPAAPVTP